MTLKKHFISLKITLKIIYSAVVFIIFQSINCGIIIIFITTTSGSLPMTETVVNTMKVKPITLHQTLFYLFYNESLIEVIDCPSRIICLSFLRREGPAQTEITS